MCSQKYSFCDWWGKKLKINFHIHNFDDLREQNRVLAVHSRALKRHRFVGGLGFMILFFFPQLREMECLLFDF